MAATLRNRLTQATLAQAALVTSILLRLVTRVHHRLRQTRLASLSHLDG